MLLRVQGGALLRSRRIIDEDRFLEYVLLDMMIELVIRVESDIVGRTKELQKVEAHTTLETRRVAVEEMKGGLFSVHFSKNKVTRYWSAQVGQSTHHHVCMRTKLLIRSSDNWMRGCKDHENLIRRTANYIIDLLSELERSGGQVYACIRRLHHWRLSSAPNRKSGS